MYKTSNNFMIIGILKPYLNKQDENTRKKLDETYQEKKN